MLGQLGREHAAKPAEREDRGATGDGGPSHGLGHRERERATRPARLLGYEEGEEQAWAFGPKEREREHFLISKPISNINQIEFE